MKKKTVCEINYDNNYSIIKIEIISIIEIIVIS